MNEDNKPNRRKRQNHLGNVLAVITDRKIAGDFQNSDGIIDFVVEYVSITDYYPFGMTMKSRSWSGGRNYAFLEKEGLVSYIPPHGTYKGGPDGFVYQEKSDSYLCPQGKYIPFKKYL